MNLRAKEYADVARYLRVVVDKAASGAAVAEAIRELDAYLERETSALPGDFRHFLARRSYHKALIWIEESGPIPRGLCGRGE